MHLITNKFVKQVSLSLIPIYSKSPILSVLKRTCHSTPILFNKNESTPPQKNAIAEGGVVQSQASSEKTPMSQEDGNRALKAVRVRRPKYKLWLNNEGNRFINVSKGPNYLNTTTPFPMNPFFKPQPPLNDRTKEEIWLKFTEAEQTPRKIGGEYGISIKRVEAILKLKKMEKEMIKKGITLQENLRENMESLLGARSFHTEPLTDMLPKIGKPNFTLVDENKDFSPEDAAKALRRPSLAKLQEKELGEELLHPFRFEEISKKSILVDHNKKDPNQRFQFQFKILGKEQYTILRDRDGSLHKI
ncbi:17224_t:CDS:2 [Funneliformis geosporum]|uniref:913_t:CDS:1 n=1 Tax=Funneliformis geosporum TaxID=1117311 RepID=A0A9W4SH44_9GLOM|nr:913_t:CDS:2 [Funneliformis geosporum]CAI2183165.1 17224_t:CDS:2 [Funneliformis geosporum]